MAPTWAVVTDESLDRIYTQTGHEAVDESMMKRETKIHLTIDEMIKMYEKTNKVGLSLKDAGNVYKSITEYLEYWKNMIDTTSYGKENAPLEELIKYDEFANIIGLDIGIPVIERIRKAKEVFQPSIIQTAINALSNDKPKEIKMTRERLDSYFESELYKSDD